MEKHVILALCSHERGIFYERFFHCNSNSTQHSFCSFSGFNEMIAIKFCTYHDSCAVVACANFWCDLIASNCMTVIRIFRLIWTLVYPLSFLANKQRRNQDRQISPHIIFKTRLAREGLCDTKAETYYLRCIQCYKYVVNKPSYELVNQWLASLISFFALKNIYLEVKLVHFWLLEIWDMEILKTSQIKNRKCGLKWGHGLIFQLGNSTNLQEEGPSMTKLVAITLTS